VPEIAAPVARVSSLLLSSFIRQSEQQAVVHETSGRVFRDIDGLMERSRSSAAQLQNIYQSVAEAAKKPPAGQLLRIRSTS
jgi:hypothetical protein